MNETDLNILGNFTVRRLNGSDFLVFLDPLTHHHMRITNETLLRRSEPYPTYEFAEFRESEFYLKVNIVCMCVCLSSNRNYGFHSHS